jgi:hypothetical protein
MFHIPENHFDVDLFSNRDWRVRPGYLGNNHLRNPPKGFDMRKWKVDQKRIAQLAFSVARMQREHEEAEEAIRRDSGAEEALRQGSEKELQALESPSPEVNGADIKPKASDSSNAKKVSKRGRRVRENNYFKETDTGELLEDNNLSPSEVEKGPPVEDKNVPPAFFSTFMKTLYKAETPVGKWIWRKAGWNSEQGRWRFRKDFEYATKDSLLPHSFLRGKAGSESEED